MRIAICEDNDADAKTLVEHISRYFSEIHAPCDIIRFQTGKAFTADYTPGAFTIVFMDIYMDGVGPDGMDASAFIRRNDPPCKIIFTTSSRDFAIDGHKLNVVHYLVKPFGFKDVKEALDRCCGSISKEMRSVTIVSNRMEIKVFLKDIFYIEYINRKTVIHTTTGNIETYTPLNDLEKQMGSSAFLRCHKGFIVNMDNISRLQGDDFVMKNGELVNIRQKGGKETKDAFAKHFFEKTMENGNG